MIILPTLGRPQNIKRFFDAYRATGATLPVHLVFDKADVKLPEYAALDYPSNCKKVGVTAGTRLKEIFNAMFTAHPNEPFYGIVADDIVPETEGWDVKLRDACAPDKIAWGYDGIKNETLCTHPFIGGELARKLGWLACPALRHYYIDNVWKEIADGLGKAVYLPDVRTPHYHPSQGLATVDSTYKNQPNHRRDKVVFRKYYCKELPKLLQTIQGTIKEAA